MVITLRDHILKCRKLEMIFGSSKLAHDTHGVVGVFHLTL